MSTTIAPEFVTANRSHHLSPMTGRSPFGCPFDKEEVWPIIRVTVPRAGTVRAEFHCSRYAYTDSQAENAQLSEWRILLRDVREDGDEVRGALASGVGPATRTIIEEQCEPLIREWLDSVDYRASRHATARHAVVRMIKDAAGRGAYAFETVRTFLAAAEEDLAPVDVSQLKTAVETLAATLETLDT